MDQAMAAFVAWSSALPSPTAGFLGSLSGASLGLIAVLLGALLNAQLNRNRDARLRTMERRALASALRAEMVVSRDSMLSNAQRAQSDQGPDDDMVAPDYAQLLTIWPAVADQVRLLRPETVEKLVTAFGVLPHHIDILTSLGCKILPRRAEHDNRVRLFVPAALRKHYAAAAEGVAARFSEAITALDREIAR